MKVVALVGASGTGKSYRAIGVAYEKNIGYIIDDGLLIKKNKIIAGKSAKRQDTSIAAVKTALFTHDDHRQEVIDIIKSENPKGILILGTSKRMVDKIANHLELHSIDEYVYIEEISTEEERKLAKKQRHELGKHVIPVPTFEIKKDFSGYFIDPLKILRKRENHHLHISEKSIVRPTYSYMGKYTISDKVIFDLVHYALKKIKEVHKVFAVDIRNSPNGTVIHIDVCAIYGVSLKELALKIQNQVKKEVEYMTALNIMSVNVLIKKIIISSKIEKNI
ncbi:Asp23/Gls24 family envelope stress response protein [Inediibacterium massiliense]|uniref:Asp23/Gls24 family envelope stress response protein n=1 Tax=Inediibacterium massiliense TaxID=1658111 RepID=UPI0006B48707|nr:Asp23/Gls24 family envelope stress response protein [Inediibacterium massiliense]